MGRTKKVCLCDMDWLNRDYWRKYHLGKNDVRLYANGHDSCPACGCYYWDFADEGAMMLWKLATSIAERREVLKK